MPQSTLDVIFGAVLVALLGVGVTAMWRQADGNKRTAEQLTLISVNLAELNTGASAGARAAIADLRRDLGGLRKEHDDLAERHAAAQLNAATFAERLNTVREQVHDVRRRVETMHGPPPPATR